MTSYHKGGRCYFVNSQIQSPENTIKLTLTKHNVLLYMYDSQVFNM